MLQEKLNLLQQDLDQKQSSEEIANMKLRESEISWKEQKNILQKDLEESEKRSNDLMEQNTILLNQLEKISQMKSQKM